MAISTKIAIGLGVALVFFAVFDAILPSCYIFEPNDLHKIASDVIKRNLTTEVMIQTLANELEKKYPGRINTKPDWVFNNAGGAMGALYLLHGAISEYLIIFGTPIGTEGHTGRYLADDYFIILEGEQWAYYAGDLKRMTWKPGEMHHLPRGSAQGYKIPEYAWALEYARGWIPLMLPFGLADGFTSTMDFVTLAKMNYMYATQVLGNLFTGKI